MAKVPDAGTGKRRASFDHVQDVLLTAAPTDRKSAASKRLEAIDDELPDSPLGSVFTLSTNQRDDDMCQQGLDYWYRRLAASGHSLAPELQGEPGLPTPPLLEAFRRGRLQVCLKGQKLQDLDDEVRSYAIILFGHCRRRCRIPCVRGKPEDGDEVDLIKKAGIDSDGLVYCDTVYAGESLGIAPGEQKSAYDIQMTEKGVLLHLSLEDYAATLRPGQRAVQARAVDFLKQHQLCPQATVSQLQRLVSVLRHRKVRRGTQIAKAGDLQRHVVILREGCISVSQPKPENEPRNPQEDAAEDMDSSDEERQEWERLERMRDTVKVAKGANQQNEAAANENRNARLQSLSCGPAKRRFAKKERPSFTNVSKRSKDIVVSHVTEPGAMIGEEALLYDQYWDLAVAKNCWNARAETDTCMYVADMTMFRHLAMCIGSDSLADGVVTKFERIGLRIDSSKKATKRMDKFARQLQTEEKRRQKRQDIRLPARGGGYKGVTEIDDVNDWLTVVFKHRRHPPDDAHPPNLTCLEALDLRPNFVNRAHGAMAPGLKSVLKEAELREHGLLVTRNYRNPIRGHSGERYNPIGSVVAPGVNFVKQALPPQPEPHALEAGSNGEATGPSGPGIFFQTQPDVEDLALMRPVSRSTISHSSSVPALPRLNNGSSPGATTAVAVSFSVTTLGTAGFGASAHDVRTQPKNAKTPLLQDLPQAETLKAKKRREASSNMQVAKIFSREVAGRSFVVLTDKVDARKALTHATQQVELLLTFVKSTNALWKQLRDPKERYDVLVLDLAMSDLRVEDMLRTVRNHVGYERMPIVVLSADRELSDMVQRSCSFVVYRPFSAKTLRESLLWCLDRRLLAGRYDPHANDGEGSPGFGFGEEKRDLQVEASPNTSSVEGCLAQNLIDRTDSPVPVMVS